MTAIFQQNFLHFKNVINSLDYGVAFSEHHLLYLTGNKA